MNQINTYWRIAKRGWWVILLTAVAAVGASLLYSSLSARTYLTTTRYIVSPKAIYADESDFFRSLDTLDRRSIIATYAEVFGSNRIFGEAAAVLGESPENLDGYAVTAVGLPDANIVEVSVVGQNPTLVMQLAEAVGDQSTAYIQDLYFLYEITLLDAPSVPENPISPTPLRDAAIAGILGLVVGAGLAILYVSIIDKRAEETQTANTAEQVNASEPQIN